MTAISHPSVDVTCWRLLRREVLQVMLILLALELFVRIPPVETWLDDHLADYELYLRYAWYLPAYERELQDGIQHNLWMIGSSYMMTSMNPETVQTGIQQAGFDDVTVQNYGFTQIRNLKTTAEVLENDLFRYSKPRYVVLMLSEPNFTQAAGEREPIQDSPYEEVFILPDTLDDYAAAFLYRASHLFRYIILLRNYLLFDKSVPLTMLPQGGFTERFRTLDCQPQENPSLPMPPVRLDMDGGIARMESFLAAMKGHNIEVVIVHIPLSACSVFRTYGSFDNYKTYYLDPLTDYLSEWQLPFYEMDTRFYTDFTPEEHNAYFDDSSHANRHGAAIFSQWAAEYLAEWLGTLGAQSHDF